MTLTGKLPPPGPWETVATVAEAIRSRLPGGWGLELLDGPEPVSGADAALRIEAPSGEVGRVLMQAKPAFEARDIPATGERAAGSPAAPFEIPMIVTRFLNPRVRERLEAEGLAYADATGNLFLALPRPALFLRDVGAARDPWRGPGRPRTSFKGPPAARVVRALVDFAPPMTVPELIERSEVSTGAGYRVVEFLEREGLIARRRRGPITQVEWRTILERWAEDYAPDLEAGPLRLLEPRGVGKVLERLSAVRVKERYVLTGSAAAAFFEKYAQTRMVLIYADSPLDLSRSLQLRPVETGANVLLVRPSDDVVFMRSAKRDGLRVAAPSQIAADLTNGPGRSPAEAEALLAWMEANEPLWRRSPGTDAASPPRRS